MVDATISRVRLRDLARLAALARLRPAEPASTVPALRRAGRSPMLPASASVRLDAQTHQLAPRSRRSHGIAHPGH